MKVKDFIEDCKNYEIAHDEDLEANDYRIKKGYWDRVIFYKSQGVRWDIEDELFEELKETDALSFFNDWAKKNNKNFENCEYDNEYLVKTISANYASILIDGYKDFFKNIKNLEKEIKFIFVFDDKNLNEDYLVTVEEDEKFCNVYLNFDFGHCDLLGEYVADLIY